MNDSEIQRLEPYFQHRFHSETLFLKPVPDKPAAGVFKGERFLGIVTRDEDEGEVSYDFVMRLDGEEERMTQWELTRLQQVMSEVLNDPKVEVRRRAQKDDSAEVYSDDEFLGVLFLNVEGEDGAVSYNMGILDIDLEEFESGNSVPDA